jgi:hypothetical protein
MSCRLNRNKQKQKKHWPYFATDTKKKHGPQQCPLDLVQLCAICAKDHATEQCPSLTGLKVFFREVEEETKLLYLMAQCLQWQALPQVHNKIPLLSFLDSIIDSKIMETHGRASHFLTLPGSPNNILMPSGQTNLLQILAGQISLLHTLLGQTHNTSPNPRKIQVITPILHSGPTQLPKNPIGTKIGSIPWELPINPWG